MAATICYLLRTIDENGNAQVEFRHFTTETGVLDATKLIEDRDPDAQLGGDTGVLAASVEERELTAAELSEWEGRMRRAAE